MGTHGVDRRCTILRDTDDHVPGRLEQTLRETPEAGVIVDNQRRRSHVLMVAHVTDQVTPGFP